MGSSVLDPYKEKPKSGPPQKVGPYKSKPKGTFFFVTQGKQE